DRHGVQVPAATLADGVSLHDGSSDLGPTGAEFTATVTNWTGAGWITIAPAGSPDSAYQAWVYVSSLATVGNTKTWKVTPPTAGSSEERTSELQSPDHRASPPLPDDNH